MYIFMYIYIYICSNASVAIDDRTKIIIPNQ